MGVGGSLFIIFFAAAIYPTIFLHTLTFKLSLEANALNHNMLNTQRRLNMFEALLEIFKLFHVSP